MGVTAMNNADQKAGLELLVGGGGLALLLPGHMTMSQFCSIPAPQFPLPSGVNSKADLTGPNEEWV
jgi:hypothetical protein